jgi:WXG100 family type VII secretion target
MSSYDEIKLDYELAEAMAKTFKQSADQIEAAITEMKSLVTIIDGGALLGRGGTSLNEALTGKLSPALSRLMAKFIELEADVQSAIRSMRDADQESSGKFN